MVIIRHSSRRALQSIYTSKNIIANYGNYCNKRIFNTDLCLSQTERSEGEKGMIVKMQKIDIEQIEECLEIIEHNFLVIYNSKSNGDDDDGDNKNMVS